MMRDLWRAIRVGTLIGVPAGVVWAIFVRRYPWQVREVRRVFREL
jgi:hypothetical protein